MDKISIIKARLNAYWAELEGNVQDISDAQEVLKLIKKA